MMDAAQLRALFPLEQEIPAEHRLLGPIHQRSYLLDGELRPWTGKVHTVLSAVCVRDADGELRQVESAAIPRPTRRRPMRRWRRLSRPTTMAGASGPPCRWRSASPACRSSPGRCRRAREEVVRLLMWEIGKSLQTPRRSSTARWTISVTPSRP